MQENKPILIVGLGNPGAEYAKTRHNVGFMAVDAMVGAGATWKSEKNALTYKSELDGHSVIFAKPQTYMNDSGRAVLALMTFYKIPLENLIVIHDDMDLPNGKMPGAHTGVNAPVLFAVIELQSIATYSPGIEIVSCISEHQIVFGICFRP